MSLSGVALSPLLKNRVHLGKMDDRSSYLPWSVRYSIILVLVSVTFLQRFGLNLGFYAIDVSLFAQYILLACLLITGIVQIERIRFIIFAGILLIACCSSLLNLQDMSFTSLALLIVLYTPFIFCIHSTSKSDSFLMWTLRVNCNIALLCAFVGIIQFCAQFSIHDAWLFDFRDLIPPIISAEEGSNTAIPVGSLFKTNGFFFREPSSFSTTMAIALVCELAIFKRYIRSCLLGLPLLLSYSGTGLLTLMIAFMFPIRERTVLRYAFLAGAAYLVFSIFGDVLDLSFTVSRIGEFGTQGTSGYARFISPFELLGLGLERNFWSPYLGNGPGTITNVKTIRDYEMFDPTWAKMIFEYGFFGFALISSFLLYVTRSISFLPEYRASLMAAWLLMGGHLLAPEKTTALYVLAAMWPAAMKPSVKKPTKKSTTESEI